MAYSCDCNRKGVRVELFRILGRVWSACANFGTDISPLAPGLHPEAIGAQHTTTHITNLGCGHRIFWTVKELGNPCSEICGLLLCYVAWHHVRPLMLRFGEFFDPLSTSFGCLLGDLARHSPPNLSHGCAGQCRFDRPQIS